jgi:DNA-binding NarL/FixJ family response regulator
MEFYILGGMRKIRLSLECKFNLPSDACIFFCAYIECMTDIRVLIVDDIERVRQDLCTFLTLTGDIEIIGEASNGLEAVQLVETLCPQVVLMDLEMPVMDGYEAARQIKAMQPSCRVIALTIHAGEAERQQALQAGMADVVLKGAPLEVLLQAIWAATADEKSRS